MPVSRKHIITKTLQFFWQSNEFSLSKLTGDAGTRTYYRSSIDDESVILMDRQEAFDQQTDPFVVISGYLRKQGLPVPKILSYHTDHGILLIEDLGDTTLQYMIEKNSDSTLEQLYSQVLDVLVKMHTKCLNDKKLSHAPCYSLRFDYQKLKWELDFFLQHFVEVFRNKILNPRQSVILNECFDALCYQLDKERPLVFTHRDFHSRNLMVLNNQIRMIDYQDARLGLPEYDLASILRDAYIQLPENFIENFLTDYYRLTKDDRDPKWRRSIFSYMCLQRNLKALGTFGYQATHKRNSYYLKYLSILHFHINRELDLLDFSDSQATPHLPNIPEFREVLNDIFV
ncbi:phosphotransferase [bacterium]|nr:phosphotransferase [bacterium]